MSTHAVTEPYKPGPGPYQVESFLLDLHDDARDRDVPVKVYRPVGAEGARPVVLVSHGLGGSREGLSYLGERWASYGYACVHMQHAGSDESVWKDLRPREVMAAMRRAAADPRNALDRAGDTRFVLDELTRMNTDAASKLHGQLDLDRAAIAGHSFGAWTCLAAGGLGDGVRPGGGGNREPRIKCMIPLSSPVVASERRYEQAYEPIAIPALHMTGTLDQSPVSDTTPEQRRVPYDYSPGVSKGGPAKYLINFDGADHVTFSGETNTRRRLREADPASDPVFHALILQSGTAFLDAYLLGDAEALKWLNDGGLVEAVGDKGAVEMDAE